MTEGKPKVTLTCSDHLRFFNLYFDLRQSKTWSKVFFWLHNNQQTWNLVSSCTRVSSEIPVWSSVCENLLQVSITLVRIGHDSHCQKAEIWGPSCVHTDRPGWGRRSPPHRLRPRNHRIPPWKGCRYTRFWGGPPSQSRTWGAVFPHCCSRETASQTCQQKKKGFPQQYSMATTKKRGAYASSTTATNDTTRGLANQCMPNTKLHELTVDSLNYAIK